MKFKILQENFLRLIENVYHAIPSRAALPILESIKIETKGEEIFLSSTNLNFSLKVKGRAEVEEEGALCVKGKELRDVTSRLKNERITIEKRDERGLFIITSHAEYNFFIQPAEDFPNIEELENNESIEINSNDVIEGVEKIAFCVAKNDTRQFLNNVLMDISGNKLTFVGSDSHKLGLYEVNVENQGIEGQFLLDPKSFDFLKNQKNEIIKIIFSETKVQFNFKDGYEIVSLVDDKYPDYRAVIPSEMPHRLKITKADLLEVLRRLNIFTSPPNYPVQFDLEQGNILIKAVSGEIGEAVERISGFYEGDKIEVGYNCNYLIDIVRHIDEDVVEIGITGRESATVIKGEDAENYLYLLMPIRI